MSEQAGARVVQAGQLALEASLPLVRSYGGWVHLLEPTASVEGSVLDVDLALPDGVVLGPGVETELGLRTELWTRDGLPRRLLSLWTGAVLPALGSEAALLLGGEASVAAGRVLRGRIHALWAPRQGRLATLRGRMCAGIPFGLRACGGYSRLRIQRAGELSGDLFGAWLLEAGSLLPLVVTPDQVSGSLELSLGALRAAAATAWDPARRRHSHSTFGVSARLGCGCYRVGLAGAARRGQRWPDVSLTLDLTRLAELRCWP